MPYRTSPIERQASHYGGRLHQAVPVRGPCVSVAGAGAAVAGRLAGAGSAAVGAVGGGRLGEVGELLAQVLDVVLDDADSLIDVAAGAAQPGDLVLERVEPAAERVDALLQVARLAGVLGDPGELLGDLVELCLLYTSPSPRDRQKSRMPSSA